MAHIELICQCCKNTFLRNLADYNYKIKHGKTKFYCSGKCRNTLYKLDELSPYKNLHWMAKRGAKKRKIEFTITINDIKELWEKQKGLCAYTHIPITLHKKEKHTIYSASLDRIDSSKGYHKDNIELVCLFINYGKNGFEKKDVLNILKRFKNEN
jgi:hypothetical protein